ncbi:MAG: RDD family protein [Acidobacteria bacterium]|nr:RDD family protein [Acidobacteriota bacterium]
MKCPKCGYIGFEPSDRCRNCGYEFSLARQQPPDDLSFRTDDGGAPLADFDLGEAKRPSPRTPPGRRHAADPALDPDIDRGTPAADLPLFGGGFPEEEPPLVLGAGPTPPLAVRRSTPAVRRERLRPTPRPQAERLRFGAAEADGDEAAAPRLATAAARSETAPISTRFSAALLDWLMLAAIDLVVVYFTLRICQLTVAEIGRLPVAPMALFFVLLNGGYLALLTGAGGQTIGKMAFELKVVGIHGEAVPMGQAMLRTLVLLASAVPAGLGLLSVVIDGGRRGLHDRISRTRVVVHEARS